MTDGGPTLPSCSAACISRGLHFTAWQRSPLTYSQGLEAGPSELKSRKYRCQLPIFPTIVLLGIQYPALHYCIVRDPEGEEPRFSLESLVALSTNFPRITSWHLNTNFSQRLGSAYLLLGPSSNRSNGFQNRKIQCLGIHTYMGTLKEKEENEQRVKVVVISVRKEYHATGEGRRERVFPELLASHFLKWGVGTWVVILCSVL